MQKLHIVFPARRGGSQVQILPKIKNGFYFNKFKSRQNAFGIFVWPRITKKNKRQRSSPGCKHGQNTSAVYHSLKLLRISAADGSRDQVACRLAFGREMKKQVKERSFSLQSENKH